MIMHIDLDTFFVSAERTEDLSLIGKEVVVGGRGDPFMFNKEPAQNKKLSMLNRGAFVPSLFSSDTDAGSYFNEGERIRGIVTTASYEARALGIKTAMTLRQAIDIKKDILIIPPNHLLYHKLSDDMHSILMEETPLVEQYSIDEFFCDLKGWVEPEDLEKFLQHIQRRIANELLLPVSIGAAHAKWIAKLATSLSKPYGITILNNQKEVNAAIDHLDVTEFPGVGRAFSKKMKSYGIKTIGDAKHSPNLLNSWGRHGQDLFKKLNGTDREPIQPSRSRKSIGISRNMDHPILDRTEFYRRVVVLIRHLTHTIMKLKVHPTTYFFAIGYDMNLSSKHQVTRYRIFNEKFFRDLAFETFKELDIHKNYHIVYIAITGSKFLHIDPKPVDLLNFIDDKKMHKLTKQITKAQERYGIDIIRSARELL